MSDGSLSQDEIDALLQGSGGMDFGGDEPETPSAPGGGLTDAQISSFQKILSLTKDSQESNLSMLVSSPVTVEGPMVSRADQAGLSSGLSGEVVQVVLPFTEGLAGHHSYILDTESAIAIAGAMMGQDEVDLDDAAIAALQEAFSQISGPVLTTLGDKIGENIMTSPPEGEKRDGSSVDVPDGEFVKAVYTFSIEGKDAAEITELFGSDAVIRVAGPAGGGAPAQQAAPQQAAPSGGGDDPFAGLGGLGGMQQPAGGAGMGMQQATGPGVQSVQFPNLHQQQTVQEQGNIGLLMDVYMEMTVELGRTRKLIREILGMGEGTIIELDKLAGEPVDILVNHKLIAKGEVVVIDENFGVRVTEIVSPMERVSDMT
jgi:flagellar motor switch protein FliN